MSLNPVDRLVFKQEINLFRGFSILLIISSHILYLDKSSDFYFFTSALYLNSTIYYVFISGFLFQFLIKKYYYPNYLIRKAKNVISPYIIFSLPILVFRYFDGPSYMVEAYWPAIETYPFYIHVIIYIVTGAHLLPFWYLPMIAVYFLAAPIFKLIDKQEKLYWLLPILFVVSLIFPRGLTNMNDIPIMILHFLSVYVFGMFYSKNYDYIQAFTRRYLAIFIVVLFILLLSTLFDFQYRNQMIFIQKITSIPLLLIFFSNVNSTRLVKVYKFLANSSFGIYFVHMYFVLVARAVLVKYWGHMYPWNEMVWLLEYLGVLLLSIVVVKVFQKVFGSRSRLIIGS